MRYTLFLLLSIFIFKMGWAYTAFEDPSKKTATITTSKDIVGNLMSPELKGVSPLSVANLDYCIPPSQYCTEGDRFQTLKIKQSGSTVYSMNNTVCNNGYTFNNSETISLELSKTYSLELGGLSSSSSNGVVAWIDYNNNGEFEAYERILERSPTANPTATQTFITPATTGAAIVRMRVKVQYNYSATNPCANPSSYGDTQDFLVQFGEVCDVGPSVSGSTVICSEGRSTSLTAGCSPGGTAKWYTKASGGTLLHTGSEFTTPPLSATANYYVECVYNGCTSPRTKVTVDYLPESCEYCDPGSLSCSDNEMITKVVIKKGNSVILSNSSSCSGPGGFSFYNSSAVALERGETYQITIENPGIWPTAVKAWIDYNGNGGFEANEEVFSYGPTTWTSQTLSFTVPHNTVSGEVRMRVKLLFNYPPEPCVQDRNLGETEDYLIHLVEPSPCQSVVTLVSPADDRGSGTHFIRAAATGGKINAENKIKNSARVTYEATSIQLNPGFEVKSGAVFMAKTGGCD